MGTKTKQRAPQTRAEHEVNRLRKQLAGHVLLLGEQQQALRTFQERALGAKRKESIAWSACALLEHVARRVIAELPEERRETWLAQFPALGKEKEETQ